MRSYTGERDNLVVDLASGYFREVSWIYAYIAYSYLKLSNVDRLMMLINIRVPICKQSIGGRVLTFASLKTEKIFISSCVI
jgi:hypothetical protein